MVAAHSTATAVPVEIFPPMAEKRISDFGKDIIGTEPKDFPRYVVLQLADKNAFYTSFVLSGRSKSG